MEFSRVQILVSFRGQNVIDEKFIGIFKISDGHPYDPHIGPLGQMLPVAFCFHFHNYSGVIYNNMAVLAILLHRDRNLFHA